MGQPDEMAALEAAVSAKPTLPGFVSAGVTQSEPNASAAAPAQPGDLLRSYLCLRVGNSASVRPCLLPAPHAGVLLLPKLSLSPGAYLGDLGGHYGVESSYAAQIRVTSSQG